MTTRGKYRTALTLLLVGGVLSLGWAIVSLLSLFDLADPGTMPLKPFSALGPLGIALTILGIVLTIRRQAEEE